MLWCVNVLGLARHFLSWRFAIVALVIRTADSMLFFFETKQKAMGHHIRVAVISNDLAVRVDAEGESTFKGD